MLGLRKNNERKFRWSLICRDPAESFNPLYMGCKGMGPKGKTSTSSSWFETGLMNGSPNLEAWEGAEWIGGSDEDLVLYSPYLVIFNAKYTTAIEPGSTGLHLFTEPTIQG